MNLCIALTLFANEPLQIIKTMQKFSLFSKDGAIVQSYANHVARITDRIIFQSEIRVCKKALLKEEILPDY